VSLGLRNLGLNVSLGDERRRGAGSKAGVRQALKSSDGELTNLSSFNVVDSVPVGKSSTGNSVDTIKLTTKGKNGDGVLNVRLSVLMADRDDFLVHGSTHQDNTISKRGIVLDSVQGGDTTNVVASDEQQVAIESFTGELSSSISDNRSVDHRGGDVDPHIGNSHKVVDSLGCTVRDDSLGNAVVVSGLLVSTRDEHDTDITNVSVGWW